LALAEPNGDHLGETPGEEQRIGLNNAAQPQQETRAITPLDMDVSVTESVTTQVRPENQFKVTQSMRDQVTVVIPTLNEEEAIGSLIDETEALGYQKILVVDGYSKDGTTKTAGNHGAMVIMQHGRGKAGALITAFRVVTTPYLVVMDGDGSYDPLDLEKFMPLLGLYDFVKGVRARNGNMSKLHRLGNWVLTKTFDMLFGTFIGDVCSGMYMMRTELVKRLNLEKHPLAVEQEIAAEIVLVSGRIATVPINYRKRMGGQSKTKTWRQGFRDLAANFDLARTYNPVMLFAIAATLVLIPAFGFLAYGTWIYIVYNEFRSGYFLAGLILLVLGMQGLAVATIAAMLRRLERRITQSTAH
jgi:dolichol-phosphate mannosyltransferase